MILFFWQNLKALPDRLIDNIRYETNPIVVQVEANATADVARIRTLDDAILPEPEPVAGAPEVDGGSIILDGVLVCNGEAFYGDPVVTVLKSLQDVLLKKDDGEAGEDLVSEVASDSDSDDEKDSFVVDDERSEGDSGSNTSAVPSVRTISIVLLLLAFISICVFLIEAVAANSRQLFFCMNHTSQAIGQFSRTPSPESGPNVSSREPSVEPVAEAGMGKISASPSPAPLEHSIDSPDKAAADAPREGSVNDAKGTCTFSFVSSACWSNAQSRISKLKQFHRT